MTQFSNYMHLFLNSIQNSRYFAILPEKAYISSSILGFIGGFILDPRLSEVLDSNNGCFGIIPLGFVLNSAESRGIWRY